jgi:uncharacterized protein YoxC
MTMLLREKNHKRVDGPPEFQEEMVKRLNDAFQAAKSMGQAVKIVAAYAQQLTSKIRPFIDENKIYSLC